ncbi:uncharacterized protein LOC141850602 [Brevipalpus obovatus]|uniref:uncharacterized protein LOC141850602 n=1 Tax=Brevipalpus obovatus TaxID=246614 RepID=UPI003D9DC739
MIIKIFIALFSSLIVFSAIAEAGKWEDALIAVKNDRYSPANDEVPILMKADVWLKIDDWTKMWPEFGQTALELKRRIEAIPKDSSNVKSSLRQIFRDAERALKSVI